MKEERGVPTERGCALVGLMKSSFYYKQVPGRDDELIGELKEIAGNQKRYGYRRAWVVLRRRGQRVNRKRVERLWRKAGLSLPNRRRRRRRRKGSGVPLEARYPRHVWTYDFMLDATEDGRLLRVLTLVDEFTRECFAIRMDRRMPARAVLEILEEVFAEHGAPEFLRSDNGPEFIAELIQAWLVEQQIRTHYIDPGSPWQNAYGESFNDKVRTEFLNMELFYTVREAQLMADAWRVHYNRERPHMSLGYLTPVEFKAWCDGDEKVLSLSPAPGSLRSPRGEGRLKGKTIVGSDL